MKNFTKLAVLFAATSTTLFSLSSCTESGEEETATSSDPTITSVAVQSGTLDETSVTIDIEFAKADEVFYTYYLTEEAPSDDAKSWKSKEVSTTDSSISISLSDLAIESKYTFETYVAKGENFSAKSSITFQTVDLPMPTVEITGVTIIESVNAKFAISVTGATKYAYTYYLDSEEPADEDKSWKEVSISGDDDYSIILYSLAPGIEEANTYIIEVYAANDSQVCDVVTSSVDIDPIATLTISDATVGALLISIPVHFEESVCYGYYYDYDVAESFDEETFEAAATDGLSDQILLTVDKTITIGASSFLKPNTTYKVGIAPIAISTDGGYTIMGEVFYKEYTTATTQLNDSDVTLPIISDPTAKSYSQLGSYVNYKEGVAGLYSGCVLTSQLEGTTIADWVASNFDIDRASATSFVTLTPSNGIYVEVTNSSLSTTYTNLEHNTSYTLYSIAITTDGYLGGVASATSSTLAPEYDDTLTADITLSPNKESVDITITPTNCYELYYVNQPKDQPLSDEAIYEKVVYNMENGQMDCIKRGYLQATGTFEFELGFLSEGTDYIIYFVPVDASNNLGTIMTFEYTTQVTPPSAFPSDASMNVSIKNYTSSTDDSGTITYVTFDIQLGDNTKGYIFNKIQIGNTTGLGEESTAEEFATYMMNKTYSYQCSVDGEIADDYELPYNNYKIVFIPVTEVDDSAWRNSETWGTPVVIDCPTAQ